MQSFIFYNDRLLLRKDAEGHFHVPDETELSGKLTGQTMRHEVLLPNGHTIHTAAIEFPVEEDDQWLMVGLRASFDYVTLAEYKAAGKAFQILWWDRHSRFCPVCGTPTRQQAPIMKRCPACGYEIYPPISTAIIVLVRRGTDEILLVHARNFRGTFYGLVAGFLEPGETLEQCVEREVREETGLKICNIRYFDSQPWPYPSGLMVGFTADYAGGNIKLQDEELSAGAFYHRDHLPELPQKLSIARRLIDHWLGVQP
ncbi:MAG TPA: NAD(+) diphosphatase [Candidatus Bacteroides merdipullorum]|uniref:NAD(+) diphosphatase n=1 Tax=Candidatus Bacteroides merdipullorum TaxID=2838474 RepID=A0A9D2A5E0_9BACE|nr:NAD(+) diphosphatase [Candidatus Bacteroides merdipullorum]